MFASPAWIVAALFAALISGCGDASGTGANAFLGGLFSSGSPATDEHGPVIVQSATLMDGKVEVSGPEGYCIDPASLETRATSGFAVLASCNILSGGVRGPIVEPALVTVTARIAGPEPLTPQDIASALDAEVLDGSKTGRLSLAQLATGGERGFKGADPKHWRATFAVNGTEIALALYAPKGSPLVGKQGGAFLRALRNRIRVHAAPNPPADAGNAT